MSVTSKVNQYWGVNAHLHSHLQNTAGAWEEFHTAHLVDLARTIETQLPPGYRVRLERSLQIRDYHPDTGEKIYRPKPDITIIEVGSVARTGIPFGSALATPTAIFPVIETLPEQDEAEYLRSLVIHEMVGGEMGKPVTRIELLSPTNKPPGDGAEQYIAKRDTALRSGLPLVEIDYLHESASPIRSIPSYPNGQAGSYPYTIAVTDPRPSLPDGQAFVYGFRVDDPIPAVAIPLSGEEFLPFDFGVPYHQTFSSLSSFYEAADYEQRPVHFHRYHPVDQERILKRQAAILEALRRGQKLEDGPFSIEGLQ